MGSHMPSSEDLSSIQFSGGRMLLGKERITDSLHINEYAAHNNRH